MTYKQPELSREYIKEVFLRVKTKGKDMRCPCCGRLADRLLIMSSGRPSFTLCGDCISLCLETIVEADPKTEYGPRRYRY